MIQLEFIRWLQANERGVGAAIALTEPTRFSGRVLSPDELQNLTPSSRTAEPGPCSDPDQIHNLEGKPFPSWQCGSSPPDRGILSDTLKTRIQAVWPAADRF